MNSILYLDNINKKIDGNYKKKQTNSRAEKYNNK